MKSAVLVVAFTLLAAPLAYRIPWRPAFSHLSFRACGPRNLMKITKSFVFNVPAFGASCFSTLTNVSALPDAGRTLRPRSLLRDNAHLVKRLRRRIHSFRFVFSRNSLSAFYGLSSIPISLGTRFARTAQKACHGRMVGRTGFVNYRRVIEEFSRRSIKALEWIELGLDEQHACVEAAKAIQEAAACVRLETLLH